MCLQKDCRAYMKLLPYYFIVIDDIEYGKGILKDILEKEAREEEEETTEQEGKQTENNIDLTATEKQKCLAVSLEKMFDTWEAKIRH